LLRQLLLGLQQWLRMSLQRTSQPANVNQRLLLFVRMCACAYTAAVAAYEPPQDLTACKYECAAVIIRPHVCVRLHCGSGSV